MNDYQDLAQRYADEYMDKVFYFCLKKTDSRYEAEDLSSDICSAVLTRLSLGDRPGNFAGWVWRIARNRYSRWADKKSRAREREEPFCDAEIEDNDASADEKVILSEEYGILRRTLAFISREYREIIVGFYIDDLSIKKLSSVYGLPEGTVKARLHRARKRIKEGMEMAREFGPRSYKPENVTFAASGNQPSGLPWSAVDGLLPKNILLEASENPSTIEELSLALGVAAPYMEEEAEKLVSATLMKKEGERYVTDFYIMDSDTRMMVYELLRRDSEGRSELTGRAADEILPAYRKAVTVQPWMTDDYLRWRLVIDIIDTAVRNVRGYDIYWPETRANGENWGFVGYEMTDLPENTMMSHNGCGYGKNYLWIYTADGNDVKALPPHHRLLDGYLPVKALADALKRRAKWDEISSSDRILLGRIKDEAFETGEDGSILPMMTVISGDVKTEDIYASSCSFGKLSEQISDLYIRLRDLLASRSGKPLHRLLDLVASMEIYDIRMMTIRDMLKSGYLTDSDDPKLSTAGMALYMDND